MPDVVNQLDSERVAVVLGATGGIGSCLANQLASEGYHVAVVGRSKDQLESLAQRVRGSSWMIEKTEIGEMAKLFQSIKEHTGAIDAVANCIGLTTLKPAHRTNDHEWNQLVEANLTSAFATIAAATPCLSRDGSIVLVSSVAGRIGLANHDAVAATKAGVIGLVQSAAATYASKQIRVNAVTPGLVNTPMAAAITQNPNSLALSKAMHPLGRIGEPEEIAKVIAWLMGPDSGWMTGQVVSVDGGMSRVAIKPRLTANKN